MKTQYASPPLAVLLAMAILGFAIVLVPALGQNAVYPSARQAAADPAFASRLARQVPAHPATKSRALIRSRRASPQDQTVYDNGPVNGTTDAWTINFGFSVSDSFTCSLGGCSVNEFHIGVWLFPGDNLGSVEMQLGSTSFGNDYGDVVLNATGHTDLGINQYGYDIQIVDFGPFANIDVPNGTSWITLQNATVPSGDPIYWDENGGPSTAYESDLGSIPSEAFSLTGGYAPECVHDVPQDSFKIIHSFTDQEQSPDGVAPNQAGNLYGTTATGGDWGAGLVYKLSLKGQDWTFAPLYSFTGGVDGENPLPVIIGADGALYGTAGGGVRNCGGQKCGLIFRVRPSPVACLTALCNWMENVLYRFNGGNDGWGPGDNLVSDQAGNLYGTTPTGGAYGHGTVYELTPSSGGWTEKVLYSFTGGSDGDQPNSLLVGHDGNLYGTTVIGGGGGGGVVFQLASSGGSWEERVILSFGGGPNCYTGGGCPHSLVQDSSGNLYGLSSYYQCFDEGHYHWCDTLGIIFMGSPSDGNWQFTVVDDTLFLEDWGYDVFYDLAIDAAGNLYGTEGVKEFFQPEYHYAGAIFWLANPYDRESLVSFGGDNFSNLTLDASGNIYGTTAGCGEYNKGTAWQLSR